MVDTNEVVVGLDDSASSRAALRWAAQYARDVAANVRAIHVNTPMVDSAMAWSGGFAGVPVPSDRSPEEPKASVQAMFDAICPEPGWLLEYTGGPAAGPVLVAESEHARVLVVGTREHTGLDRIISGSVSHYCLSHATRPVVAVPPITTPEDA